MPYKFNQSRRHKIPKAKYRVTNWPEYDAALVRRGNLTVWVAEEAVAAWHAPATGRRGGQPVYSDLAIETGLALRLVLHQPLRQTEGALRSIADLLGAEIRIPDHTTFSRRSGGLVLPAVSGEPLSLALLRVRTLWGFCTRGPNAGGRDYKSRRYIWRSHVQLGGVIGSWCAKSAQI
jgi:hypothetical protein